MHSNPFVKIPERRHEDEVLDDKMKSPTKHKRHMTPPPSTSVPPGGVGAVGDEESKVWICPACAQVDNGTPMIGCDGCDAWYHW